MIKGSSIFFFSRSRFIANLYPSLILIFKKVELTLKRTASKIEHKKDKAIVKAAYNIRRFNKFYY